jgi:hypothetical protein
MKLPFASAISVLAWVGLAAGRRPGMLAPPLDAGDEFAIQAAGASSTTGSAFFTQILDHDKSSGTIPSTGKDQDLRYAWSCVP